MSQLTHVHKSWAGPWFFPAITLCFLVPFLYFAKLLQVISFNMKSTTSLPFFTITFYLFSFSLGKFKWESFKHSQQHAHIKASQIIKKIYLPSYGYCWTHKTLSKGKSLHCSSCWIPLSLYYNILILSLTYKYHSIPPIK
jgi:hypothetical protein